MEVSGGDYGAAVGGCMAAMNGSAPAVSKSAVDAQPAEISFTGLLIIGAQLALLLLLFRQFQIESAAFLRLAMLAFAGFVVHALLPLRLRLPFFTLLRIR